MQNVSSAYLEAIRSSKKPYSEVYGTITFTDNTTLSVTPSIMPEKSISIERQCIDGNDIDFGGVFLSILELSLRTTESRYKFFDARVVLSFRIEVNNAWESVKLGEFTIANADRPDKNTVKFTAYDDMQKLDKPLSASAMSGTPYELLSYISDICDYPLGFTQSDMAQFANNSSEIYLDENSGIATYRDAVKVICQQLGCFARDNRNGQLELVKFGTSVVRELTTADWISITPADYECRYIGLSVTSAKGTFVSTLTTDEKGNILKISDAPAWDYGTEQYLQSLTDNLFTVLRGIIYTPSQIDVLADPSYDCGDRLKCTLSNGDEIETIITSYEWTWHEMSLVSKGVNPNLQGASTNELSKRLITKESTGNKFTYYTWVNVKDIALTNGWTRIVGPIPFNVGSVTTVTLWHEFKWLNTLTGATQEVELKYAFDGIEFDYHPIQTYGESGKHTWGTQFWLQNVDINTFHTWEVYAKIDSGSCIIEAGDLHALMQGQNLAAQDEFSGYLEVDEDFTPQMLGRYITPLTDDMPVLSLQVPISVGNVFETTDVQNLGRLIAPLTETESRLSAEQVRYTRITEDEESVRVTEDGGIRLTEDNV